MISATGIIRRVDELGRVVLPIETRRMFGIEERDSLEILVDEENRQIILQKTAPVCLKCRRSEGLKEIKPGVYPCESCIADL